MIKVQREPYEQDGTQYHRYFIAGNALGVDLKIGVLPPDILGYSILDIVFAAGKDAELVLKPYEIKDEKTGQVTKGNTFAVRSVDEDGVVYECPIKPALPTGKVGIAILANQQ